VAGTITARESGLPGIEGFLSLSGDTLRGGHLVTLRLDRSDQDEDAHSITARCAPSIPAATITAAATRTVAMLCSTTSVPFSVEGEVAHGPEQVHDRADLSSAESLDTTILELRDIEEVRTGIRFL
jgi:hypothetical protein